MAHCEGTAHPATQIFSKLDEETLFISFRWQEIFSFPPNNADVLPLPEAGIPPI
jgi:hypothetical protein